MAKARPNPPKNPNKDKLIGKLPKVGRGPSQPKSGAGTHKNNALKRTQQKNDKKLEESSDG